MDEIHAGHETWWSAPDEYRQMRNLERLWFDRDLHFLQLISSDEFYEGLKARLADAEQLRQQAALRQKLAKEEKAKEERQRVLAGKTQRELSEKEQRIEILKNRPLIPAWAQQYRPEGFRSKMEIKVEKYRELRKVQESERTELARLHREFLAKLQETAPETRREIDEARDEALEQERVMAADAEDAANAEKANPWKDAPKSTALVAPPKIEETKSWFSLKLPKITGSRFFQRGLEWKESLEESQNPMVAKAMDTMGAASDVGSRVVNRVRSGSETANALHKLRVAWPHFDTVKFWKDVVKKLPGVARAFHARDYEWIKLNCVPANFDVLCTKSDDLCKSPNFPGRFFYSFIMRQPRTAEIITCVTDDPVRPYMMLRFSLQKTVERVEKEEAPAKVWGTENKVPFDTMKNFEGLVDFDKVERTLKLLGLTMKTAMGTPGQGVSEFIYAKREKKKPVLTERDRLKIALKNAKVVKATYVMVLQYEPERGEWLVHNFEQAVMDITF